MPRDTLFSEYSSDLDAFVFDDRVTAVFPDMIRRSVPGYSTVVAMTGVIAAEAVSALIEAGNTTLRAYDLGCSLGASLIAMGRLLPDDVALIGVDASAPMIAGCEENCADLPQQTQLLHARIEEVEIKNAAVVVLNYTLQFVSPAKRAALLEQIYTGLCPGGVLVLSEKLDFPKAAHKKQMTALHEAFKRENGYSALEIAQKRSALENILITDTEQAHLARLKAAGFTEYHRWYQCLNFASFVAIK